MHDWGVTWRLVSSVHILRENVLLLERLSAGKWPVNYFRRGNGLFIIQRHLQQAAISKFVPRSEGAKLDILVIVHEGIPLTLLTSSCHAQNRLRRMHTKTNLNATPHAPPGPAASGSCVRASGGEKLLTVTFTGEIS